MAKAKSFKLGKRPCTMGVGYNGRSQKHGEERVPAGDFSISGIMLERDELASIFADPGVITAWFTQGGVGSIVPLPWLRRAGEQTCAMKFNNCTLTLYLGMDGDESLKLTDCNFTKLSFTPQQEGGMTAMTLQVQATRPGGLNADAIQDFAGEDIHAAFGFGTLAEKSTKQQELPLSTEASNGGGKPAIPAPATH
ncbi:MAG: hypothetical protein ACREMT_06215 [Vulcanimicrobiaceae bacterium]